MTPAPGPRQTTGKAWEADLTWRVWHAPLQVDWSFRVLITILVIFLFYFIKRAGFPYTAASDDLDPIKRKKSERRGKRIKRGYQALRKLQNQAVVIEDLRVDFRGEHGVTRVFDEPSLDLIQIFSNLTARNLEHLQEVDNVVIVILLLCQCFAGLWLLCIFTFLTCAKSNLNNIHLANTGNGINEGSMNLESRSTSNKRLLVVGIMSIHVGLNRMSFPIPAMLGTAIISTLVTLAAYSMLWKSNGQDFIPLPLLIIPISMIPGGEVSNELCSQLTMPPYSYEVMLLSFFCLCTRKPTARIVFFMVVNHTIWTFFLWKDFGVDIQLTPADVSNMNIRLQPTTMGEFKDMQRPIMALSVLLSNLVYIFADVLNFTFDSDNLGHNLWQTTLAMKKTPMDAAFQQQLKKTLEKTRSDDREYDTNSIENLADLASKVIKKPSWPTYGAAFVHWITCLAIPVLIAAVTLGEVSHKVTFTEHTQMLILGFASTLMIWATSAQAGHFAPQDVRFLMRVYFFSSISFVITQHCKARGYVEASLAGAAWFVEGIVWYIIARTPTSTDARIMGALVNIVNVCSLYKQNLVTHAHLEILLLELIDIRLNGLLFGKNLVVQVVIRLSLMFALWHQHVSAVDLAAGSIFTLLFFRSVHDERE